MAENAQQVDVAEWKGEHFSLVGPSWPGFDKIRNLFIFPQPTPTDENPLGFPFPGQPYTEQRDLPNWVGYLISEHKPQILVYNYAKNGHTVMNGKAQVRNRFLGDNAPKVPWTASDSLFVTWFGINDLAYRVPIDKTIEEMFKFQNVLYENGARNFLVIDVPPVNRSPAYRSISSERAHVFPEWNITLERAVRAFHDEKLKSGDPISAFYFSSHKVFTSILDTPENYGMTKRGIWMDQLHPTSATHVVLGGFVMEMLSGIPAGTSTVPQKADEEVNT